MIKKSYIFLLVLATLGMACRDESLNPYVEPLSGVHGFAADTEANSDAGGGTNNSIEVSNIDWRANGVPFVFRWFSFDKSLTVNKVEFYAYFDEPYVDKDGNPATASHGGSAPAGGILIPGATIENLANGEKKSVTITVDQIYDLYKDAEFDYDGDGTKEKVFSTKRTASRRFLPGDYIMVRWKLYTTDGAVYRSWSPSLESGEPKFSNASFSWEREFPVISTISSFTGPGSTVTIKGVDFSSVKNEIEIAFGDKTIPASDILSVSESEIQFKAPANVVAGKNYPVTVSVVGFDSNSSTVKF